MTWLIFALLHLSVEAQSSPAKPAVKVEAAKPMVLKRAVVEEKLDNLPSVLMEARLEEAAGGYEFADIDAGSIYDVLGFKIGDILMEINGKKVRSSYQAAQLIIALKTESRFRVLIKRRGQVSSLAYRIEE